MQQGGRKHWLIWILVLGTWLLLLPWQYFDAQTNTQKLSILGSLDRHWAKVKQGLQRRWTPSRHRFTSRLLFLELRMDHKSDFWLKPDKIKLVSDLLADYQGPIVANLSPNKVMNSEILAGLLSKPNFIRPMSASIDLGRGLPTFAVTKLEQQLAKEIEQTQEQFSALPVWIQPDDPDYYQAPYRFGRIEYQQSKEDRLAGLFSSYPLALEASRLFLPTLAASSLEALNVCDKFVMPDENQVECWKDNQLNKTFQNPQPLFFYSQGAIPRIIIYDSNQQIPKNTLQRLKQASMLNKLLIFDITDPKSERPILDGRSMHMGEMLSTAVSNFIEDHYPWRTPKVALLELLLLFLMSGLLFYFSRNRKLQSVLGILLFQIILCMALDASLSLYFGVGTKPTEEFIAFVLFGLAIASIKAVDDFQERMLVEKALSGYVSKERLKRLLSGREKLDLDGRKRRMTTLLLDIVGFSRISEELTAESTFKFLKRFFSEIDPIVFTYHGTIDKKTGDGLLAFFGDYEEEDREKEAAVSGVEAAIAIQKAVKELQDKNPNIFGLEHAIQCRIGVNSGEIMLGNTGSQKHFNYTVLGEAVNFTQRLEAACPPGGVLIGEETARLIEGKFKLTKTMIEVKNEPEPKPAYIVEI